MVTERVGDRVNRVSGKAKQLAGQASGKARLQREGWIQSSAAGVKITVRKTAKTVGKLVQKWRRR